MGATAIKSLPYPEVGDVADVPADMRRLAEAIDPLLGVGGGGPLPLHAPTHKTGGSDPIRLDELSAPVGDVALAGHKLTNVAAGSAASDAATKGQIDAGNAAASSALNAHATATTAVHGIADTSALVFTSDARLGDGRRPVYPVVAVVAAYTVTTTDCVILANATSGAYTVTLPTHSVGRTVIVKKVDSSTNAVTVSGSGGIDGAGGYVLSVQWQAVTMVSDGTSWSVI